MSKQNQVQAENDKFDISESSYKTSHTAVRKARRFALQGLYEWLMTDYRFEQTGQGDWQANAPHDIAARTRANNAMHTVHLGYYHDMMRQIPEQVEALDDLISKHLDRSIDQIDMVEHAVLLIGAYELKNSLHIPYKVVLDESMKLNTHFGATDAHKLINAVMDKLAAELRTLEVEADTEHKAKVSTKASMTQKSDRTSERMRKTNAPIVESIDAEKTESQAATAKETHGSTTPSQTPENKTRVRLGRKSNQPKKPD